MSKVQVTFHRSLVTKPLQMLNLSLIRPEVRQFEGFLGCFSTGKTMTCNE